MKEFQTYFAHFEPPYLNYGGIITFSSELVEKVDPARILDIFVNLHNGSRPMSSRFTSSGGYNVEMPHNETEKQIKEFIQRVEDAYDLSSLQA